MKQCLECGSTRIKKTSMFTYYCVICKQVWGIFDKEFIASDKKGNK